MHARRPAAELTERLRPTEKQFSENRKLCRAAAQRFAGGVLVLVHAAADLVNTHGELLLAQALDGVEDIVLNQARDGIAVVLLVGAVGQGVDRQRVLLRSRRG